MVFGVYIRTCPTPDGADTTDVATLTPSSDIAHCNTEWSTPSRNVRKYGHVDGVVSSESQRETFEAVAHTYVSHVLQGGSGVIVTHGRPGSGKTHTMWGSSSTDTPTPTPTVEGRGILPRFLATLFDELGKRPVMTFSLCASQLECHINDTVIDVLGAKAVSSLGDKDKRVSSTQAQIAQLQRRSSKVIVRGASAGSGGVTPPGPGHKNAVELMEVQGADGVYLLQGVSRVELETLSEALSLLSMRGGGEGMGATSV